MDGNGRGLDLQKHLLLYPFLPWQMADTAGAGTGMKIT